MVMRAFLLMGGVNLIVIKKKKTWEKKSKFTIIIISQIVHP